MKSIIFPEKTSKIKEVSKIFSFKMKDGNRNMYGVSISMINGDNFNAYSIKRADLKFFKVGGYLKYVLENVEDDDGKTTTKLKSHVFTTKPIKRSKKPLLKFFSNIKEENILYIDIETIRVQKDIKVKTDLFDSFAYKMRKYENINTTREIKEAYKDKAPLYPEFGRIIAISLGMIKNKKPVIISFYGEDEATLLEDFAKTLGSLYKKYPQIILAGHSIIGYDLPYIMKRMLINGLPVAEFLDFTNMKPWDLEGKVIDLAKIWQSTSFYSASLINIAIAFNIPSPKSDIDGSMVSDVYYKNPKQNLKRIVQYCERDVFTVINIFRKLYNKEIFEDFESKTFPIKKN